MKKYEQYLKDMELSKSTICSYVEVARMFEQRFGSPTKKNAVEFKQQLIEEFKPSTVNLRITAINNYFLFLHKNIQLKTIKEVKTFSDERVVSEQQVDYILGELVKEGKTRDFWLVQYLAKTGARVSEVCQFRKSDLEKGYCLLHTKGKLRKIFIPTSLIKASYEALSSSPSVWLFPNRYGEQMTTRGVQMIISSLEKYGIPKQVLHPHSFRHHFAKSFLKADKDKDITLLSNLMGHSNINTTAIYLKLSEKEQAEKLEAIMGV